MKQEHSRSSAWSLDVPIEQNPYYWTDEPIIDEGLHSKERGPTAVELFCGLGGLSQGFIQAGFDLALGADIHRPSIESFRFNHPTSTTILGDLRYVSGVQLRRSMSVGRPDVLMAGVPCQGFSRTNRKRKDADERNQLFLEFMRLASAIRPRSVVIENVSGISAAGGGAFVSAIRAEIEDSLGLRSYVTKLNAAHFGVPQTRERIFFIGVPKSAKWTPPEGNFVNGTRNSFRTVKDAIFDLPSLASNESSDRYRKRPTSSFAKAMRGSQRELLNHEAPNHPDATIARIESTPPGDPMYASFKQRIRLRWDAPSPTQVSGGIRPQFQFGHPEQPRGLTIRERCRLQSFPDNIWVAGGLTQGRVQTGNAVPPLLAEAVAWSIREALRLK